MKYTINLYLLLGATALAHPGLKGNLGFFGEVHGTDPNLNPALGPLPGSGHGSPSGPAPIHNSIDLIPAHNPNSIGLIPAHNPNSIGLISAHNPNSIGLIPAHSPNSIGLTPFSQPLTASQDNTEVEVVDEVPHGPLWTDPSQLELPAFFPRYFQNTHPTTLNGVPQAPPPSSLPLYPIQPSAYTPVQHPAAVYNPHFQTLYVSHIPIVQPQLIPQPPILFASIQRPNYGQVPVPLSIIPYQPYAPSLLRLNYAQGFSYGDSVSPNIDVQNSLEERPIEENSIVNTVEGSSSLPDSNTLDPSGPAHLNFVAPFGPELEPF